MSHINESISRKYINKKIDEAIVPISSIVFTNTIELQANGANYETINHGLGEQYVQVIVIFKPSAGTYQNQWINAEGVLTIIYHDVDNIRLYNDSGDNIAIGNTKIIIQK